MLDFYAFEDTLRLERELREKHRQRHAIWAERSRELTVGQGRGSLRRSLARVLLVLADWLDPRPVVSVSHVPARPALNGTLHHA
jgi:hypothetical protein